MQNAMDSLLDGLSELVYVSDPDTYQLLFVNKAGKEIYGRDADDGTHLCYSVLQNRTSPCPFCTNKQLNAHTFLEWEYTSPITTHHYLLRDKLIDWEGREARLEIAFDITDHEREKESFKFLAGANGLNVECIRVLENEPLGAALNAVLGMVGTFLEADRTYIFGIENHRMTNIYEWCAEGVAPEIQNLTDLPLSLIDHWIERFDRGSAVIINSVADLEDGGRSDEREALAAQGIGSLVAVPLEIDGKLVGYLGADDPKKGRLEIIEQPLVGLASFISASMKRAVAERQVNDLTWNDGLTCAHSRGAFHRDYDRGTFDRIGFVLVEADRLAVINRERSRAEGDEMLQRIAVCMRDVFGDGVYRIGDDEFCAVATPMAYEDFNRLVRTLTVRFAQMGLPASAGPAWSERCDDTNRLLDTAGDRMRRAKRGRHRAVDLGVDLAQDAAVSNLVRPGGAQEAVAAGLLDIFLMPQVATQTGALVGAEALIRYLDPERGVAAQPASFIPALEDMGEIADVDFFALSRACETVARWQREGGRVVPLAVNFSRLTVGEEGFVSRVVQTVARYGVDPALIEIEVTESARGQGGNLLRNVADELRGCGFRVAIDDFGVDNANVSLFVQLEFDVLKMDKSLIWGIDATDRTMRVVSGMATLCDDLHVESVAEGIETEQQFKALGTTGCTRAQGYYVGRPAPIVEFEQRFLA